MSKLSLQWFNWSVCGICKCFPAAWSIICNDLECSRASAHITVIPTASHTCALLCTDIHDITNAMKLRSLHSNISTVNINIMNLEKCKRMSAPFNSIQYHFICIPLLTRGMSQNSFTEIWKFRIEMTMFQILFVFIPSEQANYFPFNFSDYTTSHPAWIKKQNDPNNKIID